MQHKLTIFFSSIFFIIVNIILATTANAQIGDNKEPILMAYLSGTEKVPKIDTTAQGKIIFYLSDDGKELSYKLNVDNIRKINAAYIRLGSKGERGRVVVILFDIDSPWTSSINKVAVEGVITSDNLIGPLYGLPISALIRKMGESSTYVNIRTIDYPNGHIRGQIMNP